MKIEVEIDDSIYSTLKHILGENVDLASFLGDACTIMIITMAAHPEEFEKAYGAEARAELPPPIQEAIKKLAAKHLRGVQGEG